MKQHLIGNSKEDQVGRLKAMSRCWRWGRAGTTKDTRGGWRSGRWLTADSAAVCQPEPEKRLDYANMSEHRCSFDQKRSCVSHRIHAQYHTAHDPCQAAHRQRCINLAYSSDHLSEPVGT